LQQKAGAFFANLQRRREAAAMVESVARQLHHRKTAAAKKAGTRLSDFEIGIWFRTIECRTNEFANKVDRFANITGLAIIFISGDWWRSHNTRIFGTKSGPGEGKLVFVKTVLLGSVQLYLLGKTKNPNTEKWMHRSEQGGHLEMSSTLADQ
jgi:hypothetical protein